MFPSLTGYAWVESLHNYRDLETGRMVNRETIAGSLNDLIDASAVQMNELTQSLIDGGISLADWQSGMMQQIKVTHTASAALANGGWAQMDFSDWGKTGQLIREQYDFLRNYAKEIANGTQALDGRALVRSDLYADAANGTFWEMDKRGHVQDGYEEGRRVLEPGADHCEDCEEYASEGWMPIEDIPEIGNSQCLTRCRCEITYRRMNENGEWEESE
jgi:hypothetical protein